METIRRRVQQIFKPANPKKPENGIKGLWEIKHDLRAALPLSLIAMTFCLGIATLSGAPTTSGIISAIISGLITPFLGGSYVTVSGPAAGLAPILLAGIATLGQGDSAAGYQMLLAVICVAGAVQFVMSYLKVARLSSMFPAGVVEGMLAGIGLTIIAKELPHLLGHSYHEHHPWQYLTALPRVLPEIDWAVSGPVTGLGIGCLVAIGVLGFVKASWTKILPPSIAVVIIATGIGCYLGIGQSHRITIPDNPLQGVILPDFSGIAAKGLWLSAGWLLVTLVLVDGIESLATAAAIDRKDPFRRKSNPDRVLRSMGVCNIASSVIGGLTIIPGGIKSTANIAAGGRTLWANFYMALLLILYVFVAKGLINLVPHTALAAVLMHTGWQLCRPLRWRHMWEIGRENVAVFGITALATFGTDILIGIIVGVAVNFLINFCLSGQILHQICNPFAEPSVDGAGVCTIRSSRPALLSFNWPWLEHAVHKVPHDATSVVIDLSQAEIIDHTVVAEVHEITETIPHATGRSCTVIGLEKMHQNSGHDHALRYRPRPIRQRRVWHTMLSRFVVTLLVPGFGAVPPAVRVGGGAEPAEIESVKEKSDVVP